MALMGRATHVLQWTLQKEAKPRGRANLKRCSQSGLESATRFYEVGIASNRGSARHGEYVLGSCTYSPSRHGNRVQRKLDI